MQWIFQSAALREELHSVKTSRKPKPCIVVDEAPMTNRRALDHSERFDWKGLSDGKDYPMEGICTLLCIEALGKSSQ